MELQDFLDQVNRGESIEAGSEQHEFMHRVAQEALETVAEINTGYRTPDEVRALLTRLTGKTVDETVAVFPPFLNRPGSEGSKQPRAAQRADRTRCHPGCGRPHHHRRPVVDGLTALLPRPADSALHR